MPFAPDWPPWPALDPDCAPAEPGVWPPELLPLAPPDWLEDVWPPGIPAEEGAPLLSLLVELPVDVEVCGAEPGVAEGISALGRLPEPLEELEDDEDGDEEGIPDEEDEPPAEGKPLEEELLLLEEEVAQPAVIRSAPMAPITAALRSCSATGRETGLMSAIPSGAARSCRSAASFECGRRKLNGA